jgi:hypothetical protein
MGAVIVELASRKFALPAECPCCGATPDAELPVTSASTRHTLLFPYCQRCVRHARIWDGSGVGSAGVMVLAITGAIGAAISGAFLLAGGVFILGAVIAWILRQSRRGAAKAGCGESCATPGTAVTYFGWTGATSSFSFASPTFAARFAEANTDLVANHTPQLRKLLDGYKKARLAVPTPAVAAGVAPPPLNAREWMTRIESTTGIVGRRIALQRALEMIEDAHSRRELIQTVARIELAPLLDKLQRQSSPAAKRTLLNAAIKQVREDNIPDELQSAVLEKLEARLAEL